MSTGIKHIYIGSFYLIHIYMSVYIRVVARPVIDEMYFGNIYYILGLYYLK